MLKMEPNRRGVTAFLSRRSFARALAGVAIAPICSRATPNTSSVSWSPEQQPSAGVQRKYRADAQVLVWGVSVFHRENVGGGSVVWQESHEGATRLLEFNGYSAPDRAAGLNRVGFIRETVRKGPDRAAESIYFGLMTSSAEESSDEARKALHSPAKEQTYTAVDGRITGSETQTTTAQFTAPAGVSGRNRAELVERARTALATAETTAASYRDSDYCQSFLHALAGLLQSPNRNEGRYIYSGRPYRIHLSRSLDQKETAYFREKKLIGASAQVMRVTGRVRREAGGKETEFRIWIDPAEARPLPLRIEYQPRSYLRLSFVAEHA